MKGFVASLLVLGASMAQAANHLVTLGAGGALAFSPNQITADKGDTVTFEFLAGNHSVVQSAFASPCNPMAGGIFSGFMFVSKPAAASSSSAAAATTAAAGGYSYLAKRQSGMTPTYTISINDTTPLWFYCAQAKHCQAGMVMAINVNTSSNKTLDAFKALASKAPANIAPTFGPEGGVAGQTASPSGAAPAATTTAAVSAPAGSTSAANAQNVAGAAGFALAVMAVIGGMMAVF